LESTVISLEEKLKDRDKELEMAKKANMVNQKAQEEVFLGTILYSQLKADLDQKDLEIKDLLRQNELIKKKDDETIKKLNEKLERFSDNYSEYVSIKSQNEKLNVKIKEISTKETEYNDILKSFELKNESLIKERQKFITEIERLNKDIMEEKGKLKNAEFEKKKLEMELNDGRSLKDTASLTRFSRNNGQEGGSNSNNNVNAYEYKKSLNESELLQGGEFKLIDVGSDSMIFEDERRIIPPNQTRVFNDRQQEDISKLQYQKEDLIVKTNELKQQLEREKTEKEKISLQKEKVEVHIQRLQLDNQKLVLEMEKYENDNKKLYEENNLLNNKLQTVEKDRVLVDYLQNELQSKNGSIKQILIEKKSLENEKENLQKEYDRLLKLHDSGSNINSTGSQFIKNKGKTVKFNLKLVTKRSK
jgi:chromosome segregation ATPase